MTEPDNAVAGPRPSPKVRGAVTALCLVQFVDVMSVTIVLTTLPGMLADLGAAPTDSTLVATAYAMFFGGLLMFGARVGDRLGHRRCILASLAMFAGGALLAAIATSALLLVAARCVQGAAAAAAVPSALRLLTSVTGRGAARARAVAAWSAAGAAAGASGFVVGGLVAGAGGWRMIFWGLLVVSAVLAVAILTSVPPDPRHRDATTLNVAGSALLTAAVMLVVVGTTLLGEQSQRLVGAALTGVAVPVLGAFAVVDRRSEAPLLPRPVLRMPQVTRGTAGAFVNTATTGSAATLITLYLQDTLGRTPLQAALALLPFSVLVIAGSAVAARSMARRPEERIAALGLGLIGLGVVTPLLHPASEVLIGAGMGVAGLGIGLSSVATTSLATAVREKERATASGIVNTGAQLGTAVGTAVILLVAAATTGVPDRDTGAPVIAWAAAAVIAAVAAVGLARVRTTGRTGPG